MFVPLHVGEEQFWPGGDVSCEMRLEASPRVTKKPAQELGLLFVNCKSCISKRALVVSEGGVFGG